MLSRRDNRRSENAMTLKYKDISYTLKRSKRKTASIYVERNGQITVIVPRELTDRQITDLLESRRKWIYKNLAEWHDLNATRVEREYVNGEGFLYLGRSYRLKLVTDQEEPLLLKDGYFCLRTDHKAASSASAAFRTFYRAKGWSASGIVRLISRTRWAWWQGR
jgi:predicted metal-dependent hydrolase